MTGEGRKPNGHSGWPPPPDLESIQELVASADVEGFIKGGAPADEYEVEAERLFVVVEKWTTAELTVRRLMPVLVDIWERSFSLDGGEITKRRSALDGLAREIERFFGPEAQPRVRGSADPAGSLS